MSDNRDPKPKPTPWLNSQDDIAPSWFDEAWLQAQLPTIHVEFTPWAPEQANLRPSFFSETIKTPADIQEGWPPYMRYADESEGTISPQIQYATYVESRVPSASLSLDIDAVNWGLRGVMEGVQKRLEQDIMRGRREEAFSDIVLDDLSMLLLENILLLEEEKRDLQEHDGPGFFEGGGGWSSDWNRTLYVQPDWCVHHRKQIRMRMDDLRVDITRLKRDLVDSVVHLARYPDLPVRREGHWHLIVSLELSSILARIPVFREERLSFAEGVFVNGLVALYRSRRVKRDDP